MKNLIAILTLALFTTGLARAGEAKKYDPKQLTIDTSSLLVEEVEMVRRGGPDNEHIDPPVVPAPGDLPQVPNLPSLPTAPEGNTPDGGNGFNQANQALGIADQIVNLAEKIFDIIAKGQPVVNLNVNYANAVPYGLEHWTQLQGWKAPVTKRYRMTYKNLYGIKVVDVVYQVHYTYGGNMNGVGKYLTGVTVEPIKVDTAWGYNVDMTAEVPESTIANVGTKENPVASMQVQLSHKVHTIIKDSVGKDIFYIRGDGYFKNMTPTRRSAATQKSMDRAVKKIKNTVF